MNLKVAHLVSVQFGIFVGIVSCLVFFRFEFARPRTAAEMREPATKRIAAVEPKSEPDDERDRVDYRDELEPDEALTEQTVPAMPNEYSPEAVEKSRAILTKLYYEQIAPRRNPSSNAANKSTAAYTEVAQEPAVAQVYDPPPQTVAYVQPTEVIVYPQPVQVVSFARPRRFVNRCRTAPHPSALAPNSQRRWDNRGTHLNGLPGFESPASPSAALRPPPGPLGLGQPRTTGGPTCPSTPGFTPRGKR